jgi:hypothetical protein
MTKNRVLFVVSDESNDEVSKLLSFGKTLNMETSWMYEDQCTVTYGTSYWCMEKNVNSDVSNLKPEIRKKLEDINGGVLPSYKNLAEMWFTQRENFPHFESEIERLRKQKEQYHSLLIEIRNKLNWV